MGPAQTSPPAEAVTSASPPTEDRTRRNIACVNCRNSKVRCRASAVRGQPCQRCEKLQLSCIVNKFHKRVTKRSKLEELEEEVKSIKQAVKPAAPTEAVWTPLSSRPNWCEYPEPISLKPLLLDNRLSQGSTPLPQPIASTPATPQVFERPSKTEPTKSRQLETHIVSGEDIDWYFAKYFACFHPYLPVVRKRHPDECFEACSTLFWIVLYITCRRYTKDRLFFTCLSNYVGKDIWAMVASPVLKLEAVHALLLLAAWPLPTIRLVTDPSMTLVSVAMTSCLMMGLHTGIGSHRQYCVGSRQSCESTDEQASSTWVACCILAQKLSACSGLPPPSMLLDDTVCKSKLDSRFWSDLVVMYDIQKYMNRFHASITANVSSSSVICYNTLSLWESEFETITPLMFRNPSDITTFLRLATQLEIRVLYFHVDPSTLDSTRRVSFAKTFHSARTLITTALDLESRTNFLTHAPHWAFRIVVDAACVIIIVLHSAWAPDIFPTSDAQVIAKQAFAAVHRFSVQENDLPHRAGVIMETFWAYRHLLSKIELGSCTWSSRLSVGFTYWSFKKFKDVLHVAQRNSDASTVAKAQMAINPSSALSTGIVTSGFPNRPSTTQGQPPVILNDPLQDLDWNMFMDDFGWVAEDGVMLGLP